MSGGVEDAIARSWADYERYSRGGARYSALVSLGEIVNILHHGDASKPVGRKWMKTIQEVHVSDDMRKRAIAEAKESMTHMGRMLGHGGVLLYEELMLIVTERVQLQLFLEFLTERQMTAELSLESLDKDIWRLTKDENAVEFRSAMTTGRRKTSPRPLRSLIHTALDLNSKSQPSMTSSAR